MADTPNWSDDGDASSGLDPVSREAVTWFAKLHGDEVSNGDRTAFRAWARSDPQHARAYAEVERLWAGVRELPAVKARRRTSVPQTTRRAFVATAAVGLVSAGWLLHRQHPLADYRTRTGERRTVRLPDGSSVDLSTATALSLDFGAELRRVTLHFGEAYFSVTPAAGRPFVVDAAAGRTSSSGTEFNVGYVSEDEVRVTAADHAVTVRSYGRDIRLERGMQLEYAGENVSIPHKIDPDAEFAWRGGTLVFVSEPLDSVVATINRWRSGKVIVLGRRLAMRPVTLVVDLRRSADVLSILSQTLPIKTVRVTPYLTFLLEA